MYVKLLIFILAVYLQYEAAMGQQFWPQKSGGQEFQNPYAWFKPYYEAAMDTYARFYQNARNTAAKFQGASLNGGWGNGGGPGGMPGGMFGMPF